MTHELIEAEIVETLPLKRGKQDIISIQEDDIEEEIKYLSIQELNISDNAYTLAWLLCYLNTSFTI